MKTFTQYLASAFVLAALCLLGSSAMAQGFSPGGQGFKQINFGLELEGYGLPVYAGMDFGIGEFITIGPRIIFERESHKETYEFGGEVYNLKSSWSYIIPSIRGDYHFGGHIDGLPTELDLYGGLTLGYAMFRASSDRVNAEWVNGEYVVNVDNVPTSASDPKLWVQVGARYYFTENWAAQLEFTSFGEDAALGVSYRF